MESIVNKHEKTINKYLTSQPKLERKLSQKHDSKFKALTKQVSGNVDEKKTLTAKIEPELEQRNNIVKVNTGKHQTQLRSTISNYKLFSALSIDGWECS